MQSQKTNPKPQKQINYDEIDKRDKYPKSAIFTTKNHIVLIDLPPWNFWAYSYYYYAPYGNPPDYKTLMWKYPLTFAMIIIGLLILIFAKIWIAFIILFLVVLMFVFVRILPKPIPRIIRDAIKDWKT